MREFLKELLHRYGSLLVEDWPFLLTAVTVAIAAAVLGRFGWLRRTTGWRRVAVLAVVSAAALAWAWHLRWLCDDAHISFRYAENWARGHGPVFNPGERVEGYTDFLWTALIALFIKLGVHPAHTATIASLASFVGSLVICDRLACRLSADGGETGIGIAPLLLAASYIVASFATSGLETMFGATLALWAVERAEARRPLAAGLLAIAATMAHPDHALLYAALGAALFLTRGRRRDVLLYALPLLVVYVPYFVWRWRYYGDLFPNTYYAKSADRSYFKQGNIYVLATFVIAGMWAALPLAVIGAWRTRRSVSAKYFALGLPLFMVYVAKIGGDFMLGRLMVPAVMLMFLFADVGFRALVARRWTVLAGALAALAAVAAVPVRVIKPGEKIWNLADERTFYPLHGLFPPKVDMLYTDQATSLKAAFEPRGLRPRVAQDCVGIVGYETRLPMFDMFGLATRSVAHTPIVHRGRPGHEKVASAGQIFDDGSDLSILPLYPEPYNGLTVLTIGGFHYHQRRWDPAFVRTLDGAGTFADFLGFLRARALGHEPLPPDVQACDLWFFDTFYFEKNEDPASRASLVDRAVENDPTLHGLETLLLDPAPLEAHGYRPLRTFDFQRREPSWPTTGDAFANWPSSSATPGQSAIWGNHGTFVDTFRPGSLDGARGTLKLPSFTIAGDVISLKVAGGRDPRVHAALVVDGEAVRSATGCFSELLGRRLWNVREFAGKTAHVELIDDSSAGWGHLVVDDITEWQAPPAAPVAGPAKPEAAPVANPPRGNGRASGSRRR